MTIDTAIHLQDSRLGCTTRETRKFYCTVEPCAPVSAEVAQLKRHQSADRGGNFLEVVGVRTKRSERVQATQLLRELAYLIPGCQSVWGRDKTLLCKAKKESGGRDILGEAGGFLGMALHSTASVAQRKPVQRGERGVSPRRFS